MLMNAARTLHPFIRGMVVSVLMLSAVNRGALASETVDINTNSDVTAWANQPGTPLNGQELLLGNFSGQFQFYFSHDILGHVPPGATIEEVELELRQRCSQGSGDAISFIIARPTSAWAEESLTWNSRPGDAVVSLAAFAFSACSSGDRYANILDDGDPSIGLVNHVQAVVDGSRDDFGLVLIPVGAADGEYATFEDREGGDAIAMYITYSVSEAPAISVEIGGAMQADGGVYEFADAAFASSASVTLDISNTGNAELQISDLTVSGDFSRGPSWPSSIPAGGSASLPIAMETEYGGPKSGQVSITSNAGTFALSLQGDVDVTPGITVLCHGFQFFGDGTLMSTFNPIEDYWEERDLNTFNPNVPESGEVISRILKRFGGGRVYVYNPATQSLEREPADWTVFDDFEPENGDGHLVVVHDWSRLSNDERAGETEAAADALFAALIKRGWVQPENPGASRPVHIVGHSRGASVASELTQRLGVYGIEVARLTYLDPHDWNEFIVPIDGTFSDPAPQVWTNVKSAENFYQNADPDIIEPSGRALTQIDFVLPHQLDLSGLAYFGATAGRHGRPIDYWAGTINPDTHEPTWYPDGRGRTVGFFRWLTLGGFEWNGNPGSGILSAVDPLESDENNFAGFPEWDGSEVDDNTASPTFAFNDFDLDDYINTANPQDFAGWQGYGGGGTGFVETPTFDGNRVLALSAPSAFGPANRIHNEQYVPFDATFLQFDLQTLSVLGPSVLNVLFHDSDGGAPIFVGAIAITGSNGGLYSTGVPVLPDVAGHVGRIEFELAGSAVAYLDNIDWVRTTPPAPGAALTAAPLDGQVVAGEQIDFEIGAIRTLLSDDIALSVSGLPAGWTPSFAPPSIGPDAASTLTISTTPSMSEQFVTLTVEGSSSATVDPVEITVLATPTPQPMITVLDGEGDPGNGQMNFGAVRVGEQSLPLQVTIRNDGQAPLVVSSWLSQSVSPPSAGTPFVLSPVNGSGVQGDVEIAPGAATDFSVTFQPAFDESYSALLEIASNDPVLPTAAIALFGDGLPPCPGAVADPSPASGAASLACLAELAWDPAAGATSYRVMLGFQPDLSDGVAVAETAATSVVPPPLDPSSTYYWRVDAIADGCTTEGPIWSFATAAALCEPAALYDGDCIVDGTDLGILLGAWGTAAMDLTGDGTTDGADLGVLLGAWGPCP
jgi:hypothetical protein